ASQHIQAARVCLWIPEDLSAGQVDIATPRILHVIFTQYGVPSWKVLYLAF
ncbi:hypothetical protein F441_02110, partial [Phytophthora nicotianae CJ01A1]